MKRHCVYLEIKHKGRWQWAGTYYSNQIGKCFDRAFHSLKYVADGERPDNYRIKIGEPTYDTK